MVHSLKAPNEDDWASVVADVYSHRGCGTEFPAFVFIPGGPSVAQRKMLEAAFTGWANKTAWLTEDRSVRIVVNASSWFDQPIRAFDPSALTSALEYIGVAPLTARLIQSARELEANLGLARGMVVPGVAPVLEATHVTPFGAFG